MNLDLNLSAWQSSDGTCYHGYIIRLCAIS